jgi:pimeloyl-ACP methyl ester carboxylesterase
MSVRYRPIVALLLVALMVTSIGGKAGAAPSGLTGQITITDSTHYTADTTANNTTASTNCTLTVTLHGADQATATLSYTAQYVQDQRTPGIEDKLTTKVDGSGSAAYNASVNVQIYQDGTYQITVSGPLITANVDETREITNQPTQTTTSEQQVACTIGNGGLLTGRVGRSAMLAGTLTSYGRYGNSGLEYGSSKIKWSVNDPLYRPNPNAPPAPAPQGPPPGIHLSGDVSVTDQASADNSSSASTTTAHTNCTISITLNKDGSANATADYSAHQVYSQVSAGIEDKLTTDVQGTGTFYYDAEATANISGDGSYRIGLGSPIIAANVTETREITNQPTTTNISSQQVECPIGSGGLLTGKVDRNSNTLKGQIEEHGRFGDTGQESGTSKIQWTIVDVYITISGSGRKQPTNTPTAVPSSKTPSPTGTSTGTRATRTFTPTATPTPRSRVRGGSPTPTPSATATSGPSKIAIVKVTDAPNGPVRLLYSRAPASVVDTVDGNTDTVTVEITNGGNGGRTGTIVLSDRAWGMLAKKAGASVPAHARQSFTFALATDGLAWKPRPAMATRNTSLQLTAAFAGLTSKTAPVGIEPRPVVMVHGLNDSYENWSSWWRPGGFLQMAGYPAGNPGMYGWPVDTMNTNGKRPLAGGNNTAGIARANQVACGSYGLCKKVVACKAGSCTNTTEQNAKLLGDYIEQRVVPGAHAEKVDLVAQSMGGLITRYYISNDMPARRAARLIMLGTPNMGSMAGLIGTITQPGSNQPATFENSPAFVETVLNPRATNRKGVRYFAVGGTFNGCNQAGTLAARALVALASIGKGVPAATLQQMQGAVCANLATNCYSTDGTPSDMVVSAASTRTLPVDAPAGAAGRNAQFPLDTIQTQMLPSGAYVGLPVYHFDSDFPFTPNALQKLFGAKTGNCQDMPGWDHGTGAEQTSPVVFSRVLALWLTERSLATPRSG